MIQLKIIPATANDADSVRSILLEAAQWIHAKGIDQWRISEFTKEHVLDNIQDGDVFLAYDGSVPVGAVILRRQPGPFDRQIWGEGADDHAAYVHRLAIRTKYHGQGLGGQILGWAEDESVRAGMAYLRLDCMADNEALNRYYQRFGFVHQGVHSAGRFSVSRYEKALSNPAAEHSALSRARRLAIQAKETDV